jgi:hypothetical protein
VPDIRIDKPPLATNFHATEFMLLRQGVYGFDIYL